MRFPGLLTFIIILAAFAASASVAIANVNEHAVSQFQNALKECIAQYGVSTGFDQNVINACVKSKNLDPIVTGTEALNSQPVYDQDRQPYTRRGTVPSRPYSSYTTGSGSGSADDTSTHSSSPYVYRKTKKDDGQDKKDDGPKPIFLNR